MMKGVYTAAVVFITGISPGVTVTVSPGDAIQDSLETLSAGDTLFLSPGTYTDPSGEPLLTCTPAQSGLSVTSSPLERAVLDGEGILRSVIALEGPNDSPFYITNLVVKGGNATGNGYFNGGGIFSGEASAVISNCEITGNTAIIGGGIGAEGGNLILGYTDLTENLALVTGGGADLYACALTGFMLRFENNESSDDGGGLNSYQSSVNLSNSLFTGNYSGDDGGGICILQGTSMLEYLTVHENEAYDDGGGLRVHTIDSLFISSSIITSNLGKAGINVISDNKPVISNVCCWNNEFSNYNGMDDPTGINGNISADPLFADWMLNLSQIQAGQPVNSPAVDAGHENVQESRVSELSTRTDSLPDLGISDMGFHHVNLDQVGIHKENSGQITIQVSPSPVSGHSVITLRNISGTLVELSFYDITGRTVGRTDIPVNGNGEAVFTVSSSEFPLGSLFFRARWDTGEAVGRTVVIR